MPTKIKELPSREVLLESFYEKDGFIFWEDRKVSRGRDSARANKRVNTYKDKSGYLKVVVKGSVFMLSRIVYQINFGDLTPDLEIDHIDRDISNNIITNLRKVPQEINKRNKRRPCNSPEGQAVGVQLCRKKHPKPYSHVVSEYYVARWYDSSGKLRGKSFSISKYGYDEAYRMALEYRELMLSERNKEGAGYHSTHGK